MVHARCRRGEAGQGEARDRLRVLDSRLGVYCGGSDAVASALALYEEIGDLDGQALVLNNLGASAYFEGRWDDALDLYRRGLAARKRLGDVADAADITFRFGEILVDRGDFAEEEQIREALRVWP